MHTRTIPRSMLSSSATFLLMLDNNTPVLNLPEDSSLSSSKITDITLEVINLKTNEPPMLR